MKTLTTQSSKIDAKEAIAEIIQNLKPLTNLKAIMFFASTKYADAVLDLWNAFPGVAIMGCSASDQICNTKIVEGTIVATGFTDEIFEDIKIGILDNLVQGKRVSQRVDDFLAEFEEYYGEKMFKMDPKKYIGLALAGYEAITEEHLYEEIGDRTPVIFTGATASEVGLKTDATIVFANGKAYPNNSVVIALIKSKVPFKVEKMESLREIDTPSTTIDNTDYNTRNIKSINGRLPVDVLAEAWSIPKDELLKMPAFSPTFLDRPLGYMIDGVPFLRTILGVLPDGTAISACNTLNGAKINFYETGDLLSDTKQQIGNIKEKYNDISFVFEFNCAFRSNILKQLDKVDEYQQNWEGLNTMGFCTFGEYYVGRVNMTSTMLIFQ